MTPAGRTIAPALALLTLALFGCAADTPTPAAPTASATQEPSTTPTAESDLTVASLVVSIDSVSTLNAAGEVLQSVPFDSNPEAAVALLTTAFGSEPTIHQEPGGCWDDDGNTQWSWGDQADVSIFSAVTPASRATWRSENDFYLRVHVAELAGVDIETDSGVSVADSAAALFAELPASQVFATSGEGSFVGITDIGGTYDEGGTTGYWGVAVERRGESIAVIAAPAGFLDFWC